MSMPIMGKAIQSIPQVKLNGTKIPRMTNLSKWVAHNNNASLLWMAIHFR